MSLAPSYLPGSARHKDGRVGGLKVVGSYKGDKDFCVSKTSAALMGKLATLDNLDKLEDTEYVRNANHIKYTVLTRSYGSIPGYYMDTTRPSYTRVAADRADARLLDSFDKLVLPAATPLPRRLAARTQATLPCCLGGAGVGSTFLTRAPRWVAKFSACWPALQKYEPALADRARALSLPMVKEFIAEYEMLRTLRGSVDSRLASIAAQTYHTLTGEKLSGFHPKGLPPSKSLPEAMCRSSSPPRTTNAKRPPRGACPKWCASTSGFSGARLVPTSTASASATRPSSRARLSAASPPRNRSPEAGRRRCLSLALASPHRRGASPCSAALGSGSATWMTSSPPPATAASRFS